MQQTTKTRFEIGINLIGLEAKGELEGIAAANAMHSLKITVMDIRDIDAEVIGWIKTANEHAGCMTVIQGKTDNFLFTIICTKNHDFIPS